ncbi:MAG: hypothetical protein GF308_05000 [Candidatus Heimdallarchaeota archaeon]|nr:hypothetical protein [Candidatus Heimdallarchaeota archaeon]
MPLDEATLNFLIEETIETALEDTKDRLNELAMKYSLKIRVSPPKVHEVTIANQGEVLWTD